MMSEMEEFDDNDIEFIKKLNESSRDEMMELIYDSIINDKMGALDHDAPVENKVAGVQTILDFFKEREEYEKCLELKNIINQLLC